MMKMTPEQIAKTSEDSHQTALFCWANLNLIQYPQLRWLYHCPNGGFRDKITGARLKAMGAKRGIPDLHLVWAVGNYKALIIELKKVEEKKQYNSLAGCSDEQIEWLAHYRSQGYKTSVCYGWESARDTIVNYLEGS